jgi:hypothetical protein
MKTNGVFTQHPNQEDKTGQPTYGSYTGVNFSDNESLPGKALSMKMVRGKRSSLVSIFNLIKRLYSKVKIK